MRIFLADDSDDDAVLLIEAFKLIGEQAQFSRVSDGGSAITMVAAPGQLNYDAIVLDYYLPVRNGSEVVDALAERGVMANTAVIVLTSYLPPAERERLLKVGVKLVAQKPADLEGLCVLARQISQAAKSNPPGQA